MIDILLTGLLTLLTLSAAVYAHVRLPNHTPNVRQLWLSRFILVAVGLAFGWSMNRSYYPDEGVLSLLVFASAFGLVHVPAAFILLIKRKRGETH